MAGTSTIHGRSELLERLAALCAVDDARIDVVEAGLILSALRRSDLQLAPYRTHVATLCADVAARVRESPPDALRDVLANGHGYRGDRETYDDLQNADLASVVDRRRGLPVALSLILLQAARAQGWTCVGVAFPGHFLIQLASDGVRTILDPFNEGTALEPADLRRLLKTVHGADAELWPEYVTALSDHDVLLRLENNIKVRQLRNGDSTGATATLQHMTAIAPDRPELWFEAGALNAQIDAVGAACRAFDRFLAVDAETPPSQDMEVSAARAKARRDATALLRELRRRLN